MDSAATPAAAAADRGPSEGEEACRSSEAPDASAGPPSSPEPADEAESPLAPPAPSSPSQPAAAAAAALASDLPEELTELFKESRNAAAVELRGLFPRVFRHFHHGPRRSKGGSVTAQDSTFSVKQLRGWLRRMKNPSPRLATASDDELQKLLKLAGCFPPLKQRLGIRFQDPSKSGTWCASNLVGYREEPVGPPKRSNSHIWWDNYEATFRMELLSEGHSGAVRLERTLARKPLTARLEKRRRGHPEGPLVREPMVVTAASRVAQAEDRRKRIRIQRRTCDLLPAVLFRPPTGPQQWTLIYLHGLGSSALGNYADRPHYFFDGSIALKVVVPTAPSREVSCYDSWWLKDSKGGWKLSKFLSWYDYLSDNGGVREDAIDWKSLGVVQKALHSLVRSEAAELGGRCDRVILGGKSQGCCTALDAALTFPTPLGGFIGLVGHLLSCTPVEPDGPQRATPLHFFHEPDDHIMRWKWVSRGEQRLRDAGYPVRSRRLACPETHSHYIGGVEGAWIRSALRSICKVAADASDDDGEMKAFLDKMTTTSPVKQAAAVTTSPP